jgi:pimeloyl-[acyl-carrier protein] methyl ester esterase
VIAIELLPGWGMSGAVFDALRDRLGNVRRRVVLGWSLGAQRALERARATPDALERLVLIAATPCFVQRADWRHGMDPAVFGAFGESLDRDRGGTLERFVSLQAQGDVKARDVVRALRLAQSDADTTTLQAGLKRLLETDLRGVLKEIACPALVIHGENDALVPLKAAEYLAHGLPRARLEIVRAAAHAPFISDAERVAALVRGFADE